MELKTENEHQNMYVHSNIQYQLDQTYIECILFHRNRVTSEPMFNAFSFLKTLNFSYA